MLRLQAYASRTGTRRNLAALRTAGWGLFVSAAGVHRHEGFRFWIENGAWSWWRKGLPFQPAPFETLLNLHAHDPLCEAIVAPDIVCGGRESLTLTLSWFDQLLELGPRVYIPVQPGIPPAEIAARLGPRVGVFIGGDSAWKEETAAFWARLAHEQGALCHVGRVNTARRLAICQAAHVDSFDGSGPSRFEQALHEMEAARAVFVQVGLVLLVCVELYADSQSGGWVVSVDVAFAAAAIVLAAIRGPRARDPDGQRDSPLHRGRGSSGSTRGDELMAMEAAGTHYLGENHG